MLPPPRGIVPVHVAGGVNDLSVVRPTGTAARLRVRGGASNVDFDGRRFSAMGRDARWASTDGDDPDQYEIEISGGIKTNGPGVSPIEQHGAIDSLRVAGGFVAAGGGFDKI